MEFEGATARSTLLECIDPLLAALRVPWIYRFLLEANVIDDLKVLSSKQHVFYAFAGQQSFELLGLLPVVLPPSIVNFLGSKWVMVPCFRRDQYTAMYFLAQTGPAGDRGNSSEGVVGAWQRDTIGVVRGVVDDETGDILSVYIPPQTSDEQEDVQNTNVFANCLLMVADKTSGLRKARVFFRPRVEPLRTLQKSAIISSVSFLFAMREKPLDKDGKFCTTNLVIPPHRARHQLDLAAVGLNNTRQAGSFIAMCNTVILSENDETHLHQPIQVYGNMAGCTTTGIIARHVQLAIYDVLVTALSKVGPSSTPYPLTIAQAARRALIESRSIFGTESYTMPGIEDILGTSVYAPAAFTAQSHVQGSSLTSNTVHDAQSERISESQLIAPINFIPGLSTSSIGQSSLLSGNPSTSASQMASISQGTDQVVPTSTVSMSVPRPVVPGNNIAVRSTNPNSQHVRLTSRPLAVAPVTQTGASTILPGSRSTDELSANDLKALRRRIRNRESAARANFKKQQRTAELRSGIAEQKERAEQLQARLETLRAENKELKEKIEEHDEG